MPDLMSIREFCARVGLSPHTVRYYERAGLVPIVERNASGHRCYTDRHVHWMAFLRQLRAAGMPIAQVRAYAALVTKGPAGDAGRMRLLAAHRDRVAAEVRELEGHLRLLDRKLRTGCGPDVERAAARRRSTASTRRKA